MALSTQIPRAYRVQADLFRILSHPARLAILSILKDGEQCVCHIEAMLGLRQSCISQHLMVLREAGLVVDRRDGWNVYYRLARPRASFLASTLADFAGGQAPRRTRAQATHNCPCPKCTAEDTEE